MSDTKKGNEKESVAMDHDPSLKRSLSAGMTRTLSAFELMPANSPQVKLLNGDPTNLIRKIQGPQLFIQLKSNDGQDALAIVEFQLVTAVVEHAVRKKIQKKPAEKRRLTEVDYALISPFVDNFLSKIDALCPDAQLISQFSNEQCISSIQEANAFFEPKNYSMALVDFKFAQTERSAKFGIIYISTEQSGEDSVLGSPKTVKETIRPSPQTTDRPPKTPMNDTPHIWKKIHVVLEVTTHAFPARYEELQQLSKGGLLPLPINILDQAKLSCPEGGFYFEVDIGQSNEKRAVELASELIEMPVSKPIADRAANITHLAQHPKTSVPAKQQFSAENDNAGADLDPFFDTDSDEEPYEHSRHENYS